MPQSDVNDLPKFRPSPRCRPGVALRAAVLLLAATALLSGSPAVAQSDPRAKADGVPRYVSLGPDEEVGRATVRTPVTNAHVVCRLLREKTNKQQHNNLNTVH